MIHEKIDVRCEGSGEDASLYTYILDTSEEIEIQNRPIILICPGGGYVRTSDREAEIVALQFNAMGYHAAILRYSTAPSVYPAALLELGKAFIAIKNYAKEWHVESDKIVPLGFSAGGHLVANFCMFWQKDFLLSALNTTKEELRPAGMMLGYPVITSGKFAHHDSFKNLLGDSYEKEKDALSLEFQVSDAVPRSFIWHTYEDGSVPVQNSLLLVSALVKQGIPTEFHMFEKGGHGLSLANELTKSKAGFGVEDTCQCWISMAQKWLSNL